MEELNDNWLLTGAAAGAVLLFLVELILSVALIAASALSRVAVQKLSAESGERLRFLVRLKSQPSTHLTAAHVVRQLSLVGGSLLLGLAAYAKGLSRPWITGMLVGGVLGVLVLEALVARSLALRDPRAALRATAWTVRLVHTLMYPLVAPLDRLLHGIGRAYASREDERDDDQEEEVEALIEVGEREGILEADEGKMMRSIADLDETLVREIMTPRTDIVALAADVTVTDARRAVLEGAHSKLPVYRNTIDDVIGVLHVRDLFRAWDKGQQDEGITPYLRPALFVPETLTVADLLTKMQLRTKIAIVVDEYGGIAGLVTLEDLLEEIVGDIRDEHDLEEAPMLKQADGSWLVSGGTHVKELETTFQIEIGERDFDTVGGLVIAGFGRVPREGEKLKSHGLDLTVVKADRRRVYRVRVHGREPASGVQAAP